VTRYSVMGDKPKGLSDYTHIDDMQEGEERFKNVKLTELFVSSLRNARSNVASSNVFGNNDMSQGSPRSC